MGHTNGAVTGFMTRVLKPLHVSILVRYPCGQSDIVACSGHYGHEYPFHDVLDGVRILWGFMKNYNSSEA